MDIASKLQFLNRYDEALDLYRQITTKDESNAFAWKGVGDMSALLGDYQGAVDAYDRYLHYRPEGMPHDVNDYIALGMFHQNLDQSATAIMCLEKALSINPLSQEAHFLLRIETEYKPQVIVFEGAIEIEKRFKEPYIKLAATHRKYGFFDKAPEVYNKAFTEFGRDDVEILSEYGELLVEE